MTLGPIGVDAAWWLDSARRLDEAGYHAIWTWDHFVSKGRDRATPVLEAWTLLSAAAVVTRRAQLGTFVLNVMNRHPAVLARMAATLQQASGGRLRLGIGIGGHAAEHAAYGIPFPEPAERAARLEEAIGVLRALFAGGPVTVNGHFYPLAEAHAYPRPEPVPPILVGARTPAGVRLAARVGDGWAAESDAFERLLPRYLEALASAGRDRRDQLVVVGFGAGRSGQDALRGSPWLERPAEELARWQAVGADEVTVTARTSADVDALVEAASRR
ncbi:MAG TPA: LLM class flavin-dependent oxidoreductase [Candidatus Limnocylindrales bacterium]|nr:LLM class flavin-dependent oxidoreductase [Candidatus Limnocylindrales bacterium]